MAEPEYPPLDDDQIWRLAMALDYWADRHPAANVPTLAFGFQAQPLTPVEIAGAVMRHAEGAESSVSDSILRLFRYGAEVMPLQEIIDQLRETADAPLAGEAGELR